MRKCTCTYTIFEDFFSILVIYLNLFQIWNLKLTIRKKLQNINQSFGYKSHTMPNEVLIKR